MPGGFSFLGDDGRDDDIFEKPEREGREGDDICPPRRSRCNFLLPEAEVTLTLPIIVNHRYEVDTTSVCIDDEDAVPRHGKHV